GLRSVFSEAHVLGKNDRTVFRLRAKTLRGFLLRKKPIPQGIGFFLLFARICCILAEKGGGRDGREAFAPARVGGYSQPV
ncbi:MAG: hypothetical protein IJP64_06650, partial [Oscillospiraceae bacterium]|nr:hypothetical protein [Oscillospiraceae bacterium]